MAKRIICCLLCFTLLATMVPVSVQAEETTFYLISIDAGDGVQTEKAIIEDDEIYIAAQSFAKYTRYEYNEDSHRFLIEGQEADKAFKRILVNAEMKRVVVDGKQIDLKNSFVVDGVPYLPFCQMLPILNADIIDVDSGVIQIVNNELSMAELLYDFDIHDYWFNLSQEFFDSEFWMFLHIAPSYLLDTIVNFKWKRVDFIFSSGSCEDYESIFTEYLKDDALFHKAMSEVDDTGDLLECITGLTGITKKLNNVYEWFEKVEAVDYEPLKSDKLIQFLQKTSGGGSYADEMDPIIRAINEDVLFNKVSLVDVMEGIDYLYFYLNQVDDHRQMLDAVYDVEIVSGESELFVTVDPEALAARKIYELYSGDIIPAVTKKVVEDGAEKLLEGHSAFKTLELIKLTAKITGEIAEIFLPGESSERAMLLNHSNIALSGLSKCSIPKLDTEESTENYRLSLLLMLIASRRGYQILSEVLPEEYAKQKIESIENLIMGLYLVAGNVAFDTYENYDDFAEQNRQAISIAGILESPLAYPSDAQLMESALYDISARSLMHSFSPPHDEFDTRYYFHDFDGDGNNDWLIWSEHDRLSTGCWMLMPYEQPYTGIVFSRYISGGGASDTLYMSESLGQLIYKVDYSSKYFMARYTTIAGEELAFFESEYFDETDTRTYSYTIHGEPVSRDEYDTFIQNLELTTDIPGEIDIDELFEFCVEVPMEDLAKELGKLPFLIDSESDIFEFDVKEDEAYLWNIRETNNDYGEVNGLEGYNVIHVVGESDYSFPCKLWEEGDVSIAIVPDNSGYHISIDLGLWGWSMGE